MNYKEIFDMRKTALLKSNIDPSKQQRRPTNAWNWRKAIGKIKNNRHVKDAVGKFKGGFKQLTGKDLDEIISNAPSDAGRATGGIYNDILGNLSPKIVKTVSQNSSTGMKKVQSFESVFNLLKGAADKGTKALRTSVNKGVTNVDEYIKDRANALWLRKHFANPLNLTLELKRYVLGHSVGPKGQKRYPWQYIRQGKLVLQSDAIRKDPASYPTFVW